MAERRSKRARVVDYAALDSGEFIEGIDDSLPKPSSGTNADSVDFKKLSKLILKGEYGDKTKVLFAEPEGLEEVVRSSGFQSPILVKGTGQEGLWKLGIRLPEGELSVDYITELVGPQHVIPTIDVATQAEGPKWTMQQWSYYWNMAPSSRKKLLNVVSLGLFGTPMEAQVTAPSVVRDLDLVSRAWPPDDFYPPKVQLYVLMSPQGCYTDFHIDMGGSSVWYHLVRGRKVFLVAPPSARNLEAFEEWASSEKQGSVFLAEKGEGWRRLEMEAGDTLLMPGGWPHAVVTPEDSIAVGGNFQTGQNFTAQVNVWKLEDRLRVRPKFRYPSFKRLMWYAAYYYVQRLQEDKERTGGEHHSLTRWESSGLRALVGLLKGWQVQARGDLTDVPPGIPSPDILLHELEELLPPPPSPRLITIKRTDSSAGSLDKAPSPKDIKAKSKPAPKAAPPRPPHKSLGVKGRLLAKLGMKRTQPIFSLPRIHTEKQSPKAPPQDSGAERPAKKGDDDSKAKYSGLRIQVERIESEEPGVSGRTDGHKGNESNKGGRYERASTSNGGSGNGAPVRIPKIVIRGLSGLGSPRGALWEKPRVEMGEGRRAGPDMGEGVSRREQKSPGAKQTRTKRKEREEESGGTGSESLGASEKDFAKLLIRLGNKRGTPGVESDTTTRSESPFSDAAAAEVMMVSARDGRIGSGGTDALGVSRAAPLAEGEESVPFGHELSRFASACLLTSAAGSSRAGGEAGAGSPSGEVGGSSRGASRQSPAEEGRVGEGVPGGLAVVDESEVGIGEQAPGTAKSVGASAMMREFLSLIKEGGADAGANVGGENGAGTRKEDGVGPVGGDKGKGAKAQPVLLQTARLDTGHESVVTREGESRSADGRETQPQKSPNGLRVRTERQALGASDKVLSPTAARAQGVLVSPRRPPLPVGLLERTASKLTLGMKSAAQKRRAIMLTEVKPDPEVLAQKERAVAEARKRVSKPVKKTEVGVGEESNAGGTSLEAGAVEAFDKRREPHVEDREGVANAMDLPNQDGPLSLESIKSIKQSLEVMPVDEGASNMAPQVS